MNARRWTCVWALATACGPSTLPGQDEGPDTSTTSPTSPTTTSVSTTITSIPTTMTATTTGTTTPPPPLDTSESTDSIGPPIFDDWPMVDMPPDDCGPVGPQGLPGVNFDYIWVANTTEGTLSKIHTLTLIEQGRYLTAPAPSNPSNVSVALSGAVAVANEDGGITKVYAEDCPDPLNTSTGPGDVYAWGDDGCLAWHTPLAGATMPVAWLSGTYNEVACAWEQEHVWTAEYVGGTTVTVRLLDGETGTIVASAAVEGYPAGMGPRTGAADSEGNFWFIPIGPGPLVRVDALSMMVEQWDLPAVSDDIAIDPMLGIWTCGSSGLARFDQGPQMFETFDAAMIGVGPLSGCASDGTELWLSGMGTVWSFRLDTQMVDYVGIMPDPVTGVAVDYAGSIWFVAPGTTRIHRLLPAVAQIDTVEGLDNPTARSDMTGFALAHVTN